METSTNNARSAKADVLLADHCGSCLSARKVRFSRRCDRNPFDVAGSPAAGYEPKWPPTPSDPITILMSTRIRHALGPHPVTEQEIESAKNFSANVDFTVLCTTKG